MKDGALWMSRAASNIGEEHLELRSTLMRHAVTEHRDFRLLEADYVATGGDACDDPGAEKNIGSEALSAWMFHEASKPDPFGLLGAMFIIEGLGSIKAQEWGRMVNERLGLPEEAVQASCSTTARTTPSTWRSSRRCCAWCCPTTRSRPRIVTCARVTARLYALQIEEIVA